MSKENNNIPEENGASCEDVSFEIIESGELSENAQKEKTENADADTVAEEEISTVVESEMEIPAPLPPKEKRRGIPVSVFICSCVSLVLVASILTYTLCQSFYKRQSAQTEKQYADMLAQITAASASSDLDLLRQIFEAFSFQELDDEALEVAILKAYVSATGDKYAEYFTDEEYAQFYSDRLGESQGIGINIINSLVDYNGASIKALKVINVMKDSPAAAAELKFGDYIIAVGNFDEYVMINELGYDLGLNKLRGVKDTVAEFIVYRPSEEKSLEFKVTRSTYTAYSVLDGIVVDSEVSEKTGLIKILQFDKTTPEALVEEIEELRAKGCERFVFDLRNNPGGSLTSIVATLSYFLNEGDKVISMKDKYGRESIYYANPVEYGEDSAENSIKKENIGKYKGLDMVVLCNEGTASAAELFVANVRDYNLGTVVGTTTYGKGTVQSTYPLTAFVGEGYTGKVPSGWLKLTRYMYFPPCGEGYDGVGIVPHFTVELSEEAMAQSIYDILGSATDNQLTEAVKHFKTNG